ncbi:bifunctional 2-C-methyl-D-erythritol 4-phosphate cytidylyltransferase/2-C-methyl-D-erythritol 2,4-cyclodiphosphate synthase [Porphyrobacter algicida]|uniref:Bifunctional enzyme IspD/IspF n=2 Tax=Qipengyuania algicida TaxID=1836209 RepID=A0A845AI47_9SPHN|nr:bifunctional 2-C-methyl-D-erythritol 4-phosphate cytidylyltransferase/2-C-methyl-D-erythritol 2,4-cyclodiphosphate synthase [Qipengyuania algicida]
MTHDQTRPGFAAVVVAAGTGERAAQGLPKQFAQHRGKPVVRHSVERMLRFGADPVVVAIPKDEQERAEQALAGLPVQYVFGGATRQLSVRAALEALVSSNPQMVLIHDAARPDLQGEVVSRLLAALERTRGAIPVLPVVDSIVRALGQTMESTARREELHRVQTPQAFRFADILSAHCDWSGEPDAGDDAQVLHAAGGTVALVAGDPRLAKLTFAEDFVTDQPAIRVGQGFDVHRLVRGEELWLGGIQLDSEMGLAGHSDADVALHALVDAMLGALGAGDIGSHFPPSDPQWKGAASSKFVQYAAELVQQSGYTLAHADLTIICEAPKIGPHRESMRARIAELLGIEIARISVKATTTEKLGFTGRGEGIAAQAVATLQLCRKEQQ